MPTRSEASRYAAPHGFVATNTVRIVLTVSGFEASEPSVDSTLTNSTVSFLPSDQLFLRSRYTTLPTPSGASYVFAAQNGAAQAHHRGDGHFLCA